ncbi:hypothetical protein D3C75_1383940 [compost metagenome]
MGEYFGFMFPIIQNISLPFMRQQLQPIGFHTHRLFDPRDIEHSFFDILKILVPLMFLQI